MGEDSSCLQETLPKTHLLKNRGEPGDLLHRLCPFVGPQANHFGLKNGLSCRAFALGLVFEEGTLLTALMDGCLAAAETQLDLDFDLVEALLID